MTAPDDVFMACHVAVRLALQSAAQSTINHRGRADRGTYRGVDPDALYLCMSPAVSVEEWDRWDSNPRLWGVLRASLQHGRTRHVDLVLRTCREYVREAVLTQSPHDPDALAAWLREVDQIAG